MHQPAINLHHERINAGAACFGGAAAAQGWELCRVSPLLDLRLGSRVPAPSPPRAWAPNLSPGGVPPVKVEPKTLVDHSTSRHRTHQGLGRGALLHTCREQEGHPEEVLDAIAHRLARRGW
ncbi:hypothetical protein NDU88_004648 [Pleurodeles waltl]|uniref:Uncharacterized protein n=1 Tax=Pleurodeles waltl TaxID=8319 RepID=A0AAV7VHP8_PLEWA|nr:hypothetical protein NDU88_004648 [Pleurodeles waltl]